MNNPKAKELIQKVVNDVKANADIEVIAEKLTAIREIALEIEDPLVVKTLRIIKEKINKLLFTM